MPYINKDRRKDLYMDSVPASPGELNYIITLLLKEYIEERTLNYQVINDIVGVLECCKLEFIRRIVNPYEDKAIKRNGDVY